VSVALYASFCAILVKEELEVQFIRLLVIEYVGTSAAVAVITKSPGTGTLIEIVKVFPSEEIEV
jgi:hypothetical protein